MENTIKHHFQIRLRAVAAALLACFCLLATSCDDNKTTPAPSQNIVTLAQGNTQLTTLVAALNRFPDLVSTLSGSGTFTVFAPSNQAFASLLTAIGQTSLDNVPDPVLKKILQYHVISTAALQSTQLVAGTRNTVANENITITLTSGLKLNTTVNVTTPNVQASNGVVHVVDAVLVNPSIAPIVGTIVAPAYFNKDFTTLIAAVNAASPEILTTLLNSSKKTLFAPTNAAFTAAGITTLPAQAELDKILKYHVLNSEIRAANLPTNTAPVNSEITTLQGKFYLSNRGATGVFINGRTKVTQTDIIGSNGVVHVIDRTLSPPSQTIAQIATALSTATAPQFTKLLQALSRTEAADILATASNASANITLFAPTDAAFEASGINLTTVDGNTLVAVLQKHIISSPTTATGRVFSRDLVTGNVASLNGDIAINATNLTVTSGGVVANILGTTPTLVNVLGTNGVIHAIDKVLLP
ncbi:MAG: fasciclin domain-containing protein [Cyclobacteriaceae bacterium]|jgi:transforming growth factor-beta-induced protein|nr:fasciclin domain-containing protein [Flammeovirgaceae bacterium]